MLNVCNITGAERFNKLLFMKKINGFMKMGKSITKQGMLFKQDFHERFLVHLSIIQVCSFIGCHISTLVLIG